MFESVKGLIEEHAAVQAELPHIAAAIEHVADRMGTRHGRLSYIGAGTAGRLGGRARCRRRAPPRR